MLIEGPYSRCCIDKSSSAELSEAINSMFKWYEKAAVCYAYLSDVSSLNNVESALAASRWFKRGWTLQELIAPKKMDFFTADWSYIGSKQTLCDMISNSCHIEKEYLNRMHNVRAASIAKRMSWVASRETTRVEDIAYCLLGIFDVNMPMIYGEGKKAFKRLQEEIIKLYPEDHSIYAWGIINQPSNAWNGTAQATEHVQVQQREPHGPVLEPLLGLLAESPREFSNSGDVVPVPWIGRFYRTWSKSRPMATPPVSIGKSIKIDLPVTPTKRWSKYYWPNSPEIQYRRAVDSVLLCTTSNSKKLIYLPLVSWGDGYFGRTKELTTNNGIDMENEDPSTLLSLYQPLHVAAEGEHPSQPQPYDIVIRELEVFERKELSLWGCVTNAGIHLEQERVARVCGQQEGEFLAFNFTYGSVARKGFSVVLGRKRQNNDRLPAFSISVAVWDPPFEGLAWNSTRGQHHVLKPGIGFEPIPSPFPKVKIGALLERVKNINSETIGKDRFLDVIDLHVKEDGQASRNDNGNFIHVTGTIQKTLEVDTHSPARSRWIDKLAFKIRG
ncbi:hypothetical protein DL765_010366 [Monosporascus sp. GIB2]|nr:hypothetical protein DL765_010366 [Monosporascus sp. GIB2]